jgi:hypothetical protein
METIKIILIGLQSVAVLSNLVGLPGGVISAVFPIILYLSGMLSIKLLISVFFIIAAGEAAEFYVSFVAGKKYGVTSKGIWISVIAAVVLGIAMAPLFMGLGAVIGTFLGAYLGTLVYELVSGTTLPRAREKAKGVLMGRFLGTFAKIGAGFFAIYIELNYPLV